MHRSFSIEKQGETPWEINGLRVEVQRSGPASVQQSDGWEPSNHLVAFSSFLTRGCAALDGPRPTNSGSHVYISCMRNRYTVWPVYVAVVAR